MRPGFVPLLLLALLLLGAGAVGGGGPAARADDPLPPSPPRPAVRPEQALRAAFVALDHREPAKREAALRALEHLLAEHPELGPRCLPRLRAVLRLRGERERGAVMSILCRIPGAEALALWIDRLDPAVEPDERVFQKAVASARLRRHDPGSERALVAHVRGPRLDPAARALAYEALGYFAGPAVLLLLTRPTKAAEEPWVEAAGRAAGLGHRSDEASLPALVGLLSHPDRAVVLAAWESLVARTHRPLPPEAAPWQAWWAEHIRKRAAPAPAAAPSPGDRYAPAAPVHVPTYYGVPMPRPHSRVVFCLDVSQSMYGDGIRDARRHLAATLRDLPSTHAFDIVSFNEYVTPFAGRLVLAHPVVKWRALHWLAGLETISLTNLYDAVETAFQYMGRGREPSRHPQPLDMVFVLSDGAPNRGRFQKADRVVKHIGELAGGDVPVHTVAAGARIFGLLQRIAKITGGRFIDAFE